MDRTRLNSKSLLLIGLVVGLLVGLIGVMLVIAKHAYSPSLQPSADVKLIPARIVGASMAPHYVGYHLTLGCSSCGQAFDIDANSLPRQSTGVCPYCGQYEVPFDTNDIQDRQRVLVRPLEGGELLPSRWSVVAFQNRFEEDSLSVKRLIGYPGEQVAIRGGDIFIDGIRLCKDFSDQCRTRILVHADFLSSMPERRSDGVGDKPHSSDELNVSSRVRWSAENGVWTRHDHGWIYSGAPTVVGDQQAINVESSRLTYRNRESAPTLDRIQDSNPVDDNYGYNQTVSRALNEVPDIMFEGEFENPLDRPFTVRIHDGIDWFEVEFLPSERHVIVRQLRDRTDPAVPQSSPVERGSFRAAMEQRPWQKIAVSTFDGQLTVAINGRERLRIPSETNKGDVQNVCLSEPIELRATGDGFVWSNLRVYRDIYYLDAENGPQDWTADRGAESQLFLLGDNVPVSRDSRHWPAETVNRDDLIGVITPVEQR